MISTKQAATILGVKPGTLTRAIYEDRILPPEKGPGGAFVWTDANLRQASWVLLKRDLEDVKRLKENNND